MYDDAVENQAAMEGFKDFASWRTFGILQFFKLFRSVIRFTRLDKRGWGEEVAERRTGLLHLQILSFLENLPPSFLPIISLKQFSLLQVGPVPLSSSFGRSSMEFTGVYLIILTMMSYLHLPNSQVGSSKLFPLQGLDTALFTSNEIMATLARALEYVCESAYTPIREGESMFGPFMYPNYYQNTGLDANTPSPLLFEAPYAMLLYLISSSCLLSARSLSDPVQTREVVRLIEQTVIPCIHRIGCVWPVASLYKQKLVDVLKS
jgi:hypothetical protein